MHLCLCWVYTQMCLLCMHPSPIPSIYFEILPPVTQLSSPLVINGTELWVFCTEVCRGKERVSVSVLICVCVLSVLCAWLLSLMACYCMLNDFLCWHPFKRSFFLHVSFLWSSHIFLFLCSQNKKSIKKLWNWVLINLGPVSNRPFSACLHGVCAFARVFVCVCVQVYSYKTN